VTLSARGIDGDIDRPERPAEGVLGGGSVDTKANGPAYFHAMALPAIDYIPAHLMRRQIRKSHYAPCVNGA
jgi:hypothetical protein